MSLKVAAAVAAIASALALSGCAISPSGSPGPPTTRATAATKVPTATAPTAASTSSPASSAALRPGRPAWVSVSVATVWRSSSSPRPVDDPALRAPADIRGWLRAMTLADRLGLQGRAETQTLLGDRVLVTAIRGAWAKVVVPDQPTPLDARGYPGWVPTRQVSAVAPPSVTEYATVVARTTWLRPDSAAAGRLVEVSYGTRLAVLGRVDGWLRVGAPGDVAWRVDAAAVVRHRVGGAALRPTGLSVVQSAQSFTGLPYLWAGRSGFGFDCSGLTSLVYRVHGISIPRDADAQAAGGRRASHDAARPGDLFFYATPSGYVHHVSLYSRSGQMVHSPATGQTVQTIRVATPSYAAQYAGARRYLP